MPQSPQRKDLSLKWLEVFQICAKQGSLQAAAQTLGLSISTASHHLRSLEDHLGVALFDHSRRPLTLTAKGRSFLEDIDTALLTIRQAKASVTAAGLDGTSLLRLGTIEDLDSDIVPELAVFLTGSIPACDFSFHTETSQVLIDLLRNRQLDVAITTSPIDRHGDLFERPLLTDPFVVVLPAGAEASLSDVVDGRAKLPFLRFSSNLIIARQIESQLRRIGVSTTHRFECSNNQTIMAMVSSGAGWAISTPLLYARAKRFHKQVRMHAFPGKSFSRTLSLVATPDCARPVFDLIDRRTRSLLLERAIRPVVKGAPWLSEGFALVG